MLRIDYVFIYKNEFIITYHANGIYFYYNNHIGYSYCYSLDQEEFTYHRDYITKEVVNHLKRCNAKIKNLDKIIIKE